MLHRLTKMAVKTKMQNLVHLDVFKSCTFLTYNMPTVVNSKARLKCMLIKNVYCIPRIHFKTAFYRPLINKGLYYNTVIQIYPPIYKYIGVKTPYIF